MVGGTRLFDALEEAPWKVPAPGPSGIRADADTIGRLKGAGEHVSKMEEL